ncbi:MAG TPA: uroporphyrinogen-III C-methyltransferase [Deltaproteobacteria bacterium]|nr:uroporphyrinogen-III C-methyltransferase [Deltaproteobacteria bacterium]
MASPGRVLLVGAGPGDPDLITVRGAKTLALADVVLYDELATDELLGLAPDRAELINVGKRGHDAPTKSQDEINALLVGHARAGRTVVRLKGGDPLVFGRGGEEMSACAAAGIPFEIVPGVTSAIAALTYAGIPVTDRRHSASFAVVTGHKDPSRVAEQTRWRELGTAVDTLVILMGMRNLPSLVDELIAGGKAPDTPAAAVMYGTLPFQRTCVSTLAALPEAVREAGLRAPSVVVVGHVVELRAGLSWWERQPLFGRRVLVTRAREQAAELGAALRAVGAEPVFEAMIELVPNSDPAVVRRIRETLRSLSRYQSIVFTSSNAVRFFARALEEEFAPAAGSERARRRGLPSRIRTFCVGERTGEAALAAGFPVHVVASGRSDAEALLAEMLQALPADDGRILIPGSQIARSVIADGLRAAGAEVDMIAFYENRRPEIDVAGLRAKLLGGELFALTFTSPSTVDHFWDSLDGAAREAASRCMIAAIGRTTARRLEQIGLGATVVPERPDVSLMVAELVSAAAEGTPGAIGGGRR